MIDAVGWSYFKTSWITSAMAPRATMIAKTVVNLDLGGRIEAKLILKSICDGRSERKPPSSSISCFNSFSGVRGFLLMYNPQVGRRCSLLTLRFLEYMQNVFDVRLSLFKQSAYQHLTGVETVQPNND